MDLSDRRCGTFPASQTTLPRRRTHEDLRFDIASGADGRTPSLWLSVHPAAIHLEYNVKCARKTCQDCGAGAAACRVSSGCAL
ncbi:hypothetical protein C8T65DRAFT_691308, partial [Cerioporus squamosus]